jgi:hypothetical protein
MRWACPFQAILQILLATPCSFNLQLPNCMYLLTASVWYKFYRFSHYSIVWTADYHRHYVLFSLSNINSTNMMAVLILEREHPLTPFSIAWEDLYSDRFLMRMNQIWRILLIKLVTCWRNWNGDCFTKIWWSRRLKILGEWLGLECGSTIPHISKWFTVWLLSMLLLQEDGISVVICYRLDSLGFKSQHTKGLPVL